MAVRQEAQQDLYVKELGAFQSARVEGFFRAAGVEMSGLASLEEAGWISEVKGQIGHKGSKLTLSERKHLYNYGWCRLVVFEVKEHPDLPSQRIVQMQTNLVRPVNRTFSTNLVEPVAILAVSFSPVESITVDVREHKRDGATELSGPLPTFYDHFIVVKNQFSTSELQFSPQKDIT